MNKQINILIAEAQPIFREGLRKLLESVVEFRVVGVVADGEAALKSIYESKPDIAVLCMRLPRKDGLHVARTIFARSMRVEVIFLTMEKSESCFNAALDFGVKGYVMKDTATSDLVDAVNAVNRGDFYIS
ncbi:MAG: response regulator transcription factor, partial [Pyrinomonadaceae bacterium]|nr:response regulator transcription factor [Pyrinomonadaceae bacterium]